MALRSTKVIKMTVNPNGFVQALDFGQPKIIYGECMEVISGGQFVGASGTASVVGSGLDSYVANDVKLIVCADAEDFVGVAIQNTASGALLGVATYGAVISTCGGSVTAGHMVAAIASTDSIVNLGAGSGTMSAGRALTEGTSGAYALWKINA